MLMNVICVFAVVVLIKFLLANDTQPVLGIYSQKGKWFDIKYWLFYILFNWRKRQNAKAQHVSGQNAGYGVRSRNSAEEMDKAQELPEQHLQVCQLSLSRLSLR